MTHFIPNGQKLSENSKPNKFQFNFSVSLLLGLLAYKNTIVQKLSRIYLAEFLLRPVSQN